MTAVRTAGRPAPRAADGTVQRAIWVVSALALYVAVAAAILLSPVSPERLVAAATAWLRDDVGLSTVRQGWVEFAANVALFIPLGALMVIASRRAWIGLALAALISAGAELAQAMLPERTASARDVIANVAGAALGAAAVAAARWMRAHEKTMRTGRGRTQHWYGSDRGVQRTSTSRGAPRHD
ncbi:VanZ family protein [Microbacterium sp. dk485]|uniref:VanZ family protein n=1 Tax=Microbacterium sp. dk485 TaxID=2560021 RepID=UPI0010737442|nr:VanZ family protein [Microbacterium sp. dk485]TFV84071.1 VanZ family protein [Microbacterium sp. dk485]